MSIPTEPVVETTSIAVDPTELRDLAARLRATRWPNQPMDGWLVGPDADELRRFCTWWASDFDWAQTEKRINRARHYLVHFEDVVVHLAVHQIQGSKHAPLLLLHGWPSSFLEFEQLAPLLTTGASARPVVVASLPGYGLSSRPNARWTTRDTAARMVAAMAALGHPRFVAHGTDFGSAVGTWMALDFPEALLGLHLSNIDLEPTLSATEHPSPEEQEYLDGFDAWWATQRGYKELQSTRPGALAPALLDSPAGLAAWVLDKWHCWTDPALGSLLAERVGWDTLGETLTWTWTTGAIETSVLDYFDNRAAGTTTLPLGARIEVPTAVARFSRVGDFLEDPPRSWLERMYRLERFTAMPRGGHFAAVEAPDLLASDLLAFADDAAPPG